MAVLKSQNYKLLILKKYYKYSTLICARWLSPSEQLSILELVFSIRSVIYEFDQIFQIWFINICNVNILKFLGGAWPPSVVVKVPPLVSIHSFTLCLVRVKRRGKIRERGKCYFPSFGSAKKTGERKNKGENKSPGPTKIHLPKSGRKQRREKALILKWRIYPLDCPSESRSTKSPSPSPSPHTVHQNFMSSTSPPKKSHAIDFATHKISLLHPQNFTSPTTKIS